jgi:hypothetical protein
MRFLDVRMIMVNDQDKTQLIMLVCAGGIHAQIPPQAPTQTPGPKRNRIDRVDTGRCGVLGRMRLRQSSGICIAHIRSRTYDNAP